MMISIVIVNWNGLKDLKSTLDVLLGLNLPNSEVIVVDNGSTDGSLPWLRKLHRVKLIEVGENVGAAKGRNLGVEQAGYSIHYSPSLKVYHRESPEGRVPSAFFFTLRSRNWMRFYLRHFPGPLCWRKVAIYSALCVLKGALNGQFLAASKGVLEGWADARKQRAHPKKVSWAVVNKWQMLNRRKRLSVRR